MENTPWVETLMSIQDIVPLAESIGHQISIIDIGGGFPFTYYGENLNFNDFCAPIREAISKFNPKIQFVAEPGRFMSATCITLIHSVVGLNQRQD